MSSSSWGFESVLAKISSAANFMNWFKSQDTQTNVDDGSNQKSNSLEKITQLEKQKNQLKSKEQKLSNDILRLYNSLSQLWNQNLQYETELNQIEQQLKQNLPNVSQQIAQSLLTKIGTLKLKINQNDLKSKEIISQIQDLDLSPVVGVQTNNVQQKKVQVALSNGGDALAQRPAEVKIQQVSGNKQGQMKKQTINESKTWEVKGNFNTQIWKYTPESQISLQDMWRTN